MLAVSKQVRERPEVMRPVMSDHRKRELLLQMVQSQLGSVELNSLLDVDGRVQALKLELEEVKQADDEEIDRLLDQNAELQLAVLGAHATQEQAQQAIQLAGQKVAQLETANAELRGTKRQQQQQAEEDSKQSAEALQAMQQEADKQKQAVTTAEAACNKLQESHDQLASKGSLMEVQLVELRVQRLEALQAADQAKKQAAELASTKTLLASATNAQQKALQATQAEQGKVADIEYELKCTKAQLHQKEQDGKALVRAIHKQDQERHDKLAAQELVEAGHQVELAQLKQSLLLAQQGANGASHKQLEAAQAAPAGSEALAVVPVGQPSAAVGPSEVALVEEVTALKALLASVAPQLQELAGMKQQMGQLLTLLQPATAGGLLALPTLAAHTNTDTQPSQNYQGAVFSAAAAAKASPTEAHNPETGRSRPAEPAGQNAAGAASAQAASAQHIGSRLQQQRDASHDQPAVNATQQMSVQLNDSTPAHWRAQNQTGDSNSVASQTQQSKQGYSPTLPYTKPPAAVTKTATLQWASNPLAVGSSHLDAPPQQVRVAPKTGALQPDKNMAEGLVLGSAIPQGKQAAAVSGSAQLNLGSSAGRLAANSSLLSSAAKVVKATQIPDSSQTSGKQADSLQFPVQPGPRTSKQGPAPQLPKQATLPLLAVDAAQHKHASPSGIAAVPVVTSKTAAVSATGINSSAAAQQTKQPDPAKPVRALLTHPETSAACGVTKAAGTPAQHHNPPHPAATSTATAAKAPVAAPAAQARVAAPAAQAQVAAPTPDAKALQAQAAREQAKAATAAAQQPGSGLTATAAQQSEKLAVLPDAALTSTSHSQSGTTSSEAAPAFSDRIPALLKKYNKRKWDEQPPSTAAAAASNSISEGLQIPTQQGHPLASLPLSTTVPSQAGHGQVHAAPKRAKHDQVVHSPAAAMQAPKVVSNAMFASTGAAVAQTPMPATGVPPLTGSAALGKEQQQHLQMPPTLAGIFSPLQSAAAAVKEGKERAAKLAASFAAGRSSGFPSVAGRITSSEAAINAPQVPSHEAHVSSAVATAAAAAKNLIHQQALKAKQSVQAMPSQTEPMQARHSVQSVPSQTQPEGEANHQSRMEAIRLRNLARGAESPLSAHQASVASSSQSPASHGTLPKSPSVPPPPPPDRSQPGTASPSQAYTGHTTPHATPQQRAQRGRRTHFHGHADSVSPARKDANSRPAKSSQHSPAASRLSREAARKRAQSPVRSLTRHAHVARKRAASPDGAQSDRTTTRGGKPRAEQSPRGRPAKRRGRPSRAADRARRASRGSPTYSPVRGQSSRATSPSPDATRSNGKAKHGAGAELKQAAQQQEAKAKTREATPLPGPPKQLISAPKGVPGFVPSTSDSLLKIDTPRGAQKPKHPFVASSSTAAHQPAVPATKAAGAARSTGNPAPAQSSDRGVQRSRSSLTAAEVTQHGADARTGNSQAGKALHSAKGGSELGSSAGHVSTGAVSGSKVQTEEVEEGELEPGERVEGYESGPDAERGAPEPEGPRAEGQPAQAPSTQAPSVQAPSLPALSAPAPSAQAPSAPAPSAPALSALVASAQAHAAGSSHTQQQGLTVSQGTAGRLVSTKAAAADKPSVSRTQATGGQSSKTSEKSAGSSAKTSAKVPAVPSHDLSSKQAGEHRGKGAGATKPAANAAQSGGVKATVKTVDSQKSGQAKHAAAEGIAAAKPVPARPAANTQVPAPPPGHPTSKSKPKPNLPPAISVLPTNPTSGPSQRLQAGTEHGPVLALASKVTSAFSVPTAIPGLSQHSGASSQQPSAGLSTALPAVLPGKVVEARQGAAVTHTEQQHPPQVQMPVLPPPITQWPGHQSTQPQSLVPSFTQHSSIQHAAAQSQPPGPQHLQPAQPQGSANWLHLPFATAQQQAQLPTRHFQAPQGQPQLLGQLAQPQSQPGQPQGQSLRPQHPAAQHGAFPQTQVPGQVAQPNYMQQQPNYKPWGLTQQPQGQGLAQQPQGQGLAQQPQGAVSQNPWAQQLPPGQAFAYQQTGQQMRHAQLMGAGQHIQAQPAAPPLHLQQGLLQRMGQPPMKFVPAGNAMQHAQLPFQGASHLQQPPWLMQQPN